MISFMRSDDKHNELWDHFEKDRLLTKDQFRDIVRKSRKNDRHISEELFDYSSVSNDKLLKIISKVYGIPAVDLRKKVIANYVINLIPKEVADQMSVIIFKKRKDALDVAMTNPENQQTIAFIKNKTGLKPIVYITHPESINHALKLYKSEIKSEFAQIMEDSIQEALISNESAEKMAQYVPIIKIVDSLIDRALNENASDIHIEPNTDDITIRYRIDGLLKKIVELPKDILPPLITRIKLLSNLKIDETRIPQDGRFNYIYKEREVAIRISVIPTLNGSKVVLRLLDRKREDFGLQKLGLNKNDFDLLKSEIKKTQGMVLVTGPTGSGKTTTLYSLLRLLNKEDVNISTIEDPIEYGLAGINQTQINQMAGLTFANGLKSLLRQDPNILMVGEIRDVETANIAVNSAMTGHIVLSTLHTNNVFLATQRLIEMGIQPFLLASVTNLIIGQRLVRKICDHCKQRVDNRAKLLEKYEEYFDLQESINKLNKANLLPKNTNSLTDLKFYVGKGCDKCNQTGYKGRIGIFELLSISKNIHKTILENPDAKAIKSVALKEGVLEMFEDGLLKIFTGQTTFEEILRVTRD
ncbi:MAG: GspE/PulE family protein [bacterium]|nr:GspE/PulE family protein [bacterium]